MKYIDADKLRAEIERRKKENMYVDLPMSIGRYYEDRDLLSFLDTLEEPVSEDVNDEIKRYIEEYGYERGEDKLLIAIVARHFAEWQKAKMMEGATYNELMELYRAIRDELVKRHRDVPINIKEKQ